MGYYRFILDILAACIAAFLTILGSSLTFLFKIAKMRIVSISAVIYIKIGKYQKETLPKMPITAKNKATNHM